MDKNINTDSEEISLKEVILKFRYLLQYLFTKWLVILSGAIIGGLTGLSYSVYKKPIYTATTTFVLEDSKSGGLGQYAGLASLAGIDIGSSGVGGIFQGDNIVELYKSRVMIEKALLSNVKINGKNQLLIERYIQYNKLQDKWKKKDNINSINFYGNPDNFNRKQDSIITDLVENINKKYLNVERIDKKLNILRVDVATPDEMFSKEFNNQLVATVNNFYTQTKTKKASQNVQVLQRQADSVKRILNGSISSVASAIDAAPNANPTLLSLRVPSQRKQVDVQANSAIYSEIVKNLEVSKISLRQEKPLIQVIDKPILPLTVNHLTKVKGFIIGIFLFGFTTTVYLLIKKLLESIFK